MREILVYEDYRMHRLGPTDKKEYEEVTTEKATRIDITDVAKTKGKLIPFGRTYQKQLEGYNLFDYAQVVNLAYGTRQGESSSYILVSSLYRGYYIPVTPGEHYFISRKNTTDFNRFRYCYTEIEPAVNVPIISGSQKTRDTYTSFDTVVPEGAGYLFIYLTNEGTDITPEMELQITKSEELLPYEPYVGGQASPSPDYPQDIENVEGRSYRNLFDINAEYERMAVVCKFTFHVKPNTQYTISTNCPQSNTANLYVNSNSSSSKAYINSPKTITSDENGEFYISLRFAASQDDPNTFDLFHAVQNGEYWVQVEEGSTATPYEPYFEGKRLEFNVCNKNLLEVSTANSIGYPNYMHYTIDDLKKEVNVTGTTLMGFKCKVKPNTEYTVQCLLTSVASQGNQKLRVREYSSEPIEWAGENFVQQRINETIVNTNPKKTFATSETTEWILLLIYMDLTAVGNGVTASNWQVAEGVDDAFEEHKQQLIPFPLQEGQKLMEGDYLADDGVHHMRKQALLSGYGWQHRQSQDGIHTYSASFPDRKFANSIHVLSNVYSYKGTANGLSILKGAPEGIYTYYNNTTTGTTIYINSKLETVEDLMSMFESENGVIEYELAQEVIDPYTPAQAEAYNKLMNLKLYKGVTHIWCETDGLEPNLQLTYKRIKQEGVLQVSNIQPLNNTELNNIEIEETPVELDVQAPEENEVM